eukprot:1158219-Pelagomonas_calceolata.AAC.5
MCVQGLNPGTTGPPGYRVTFNTSNICLSGTSAPVFFELVGQNGSSGTVLVRSLQGQFSKGSSDTTADLSMSPHGQRFRYT